MSGSGSGGGGGGGGGGASGSSGASASGSTSPTEYYFTRELDITNVEQGKEEIVPKWHRGEYGAFPVMIQEFNDSERVIQLRGIWQKLVHPNILRIHCLTSNGGQQHVSPIFYVGTEVVQSTLKNFIEEHSNDNRYGGYLFKEDMTGKWEMSLILKNILLTIANTLEYLESNFFYVNNLDITKIYVITRPQPLPAMDDVIIKLLDGIQDSGTNAQSWLSFRNLVEFIFNVGSKEPSEAVSHLLQQNVNTQVSWEKLYCHPSFFLSLPQKQWLISEACRLQRQLNLAWPTDTHFRQCARKSKHKYDYNSPISLVRYLRNQMMHPDEGGFTTVSDLLSYWEEHVPNLFLELSSLMKIWS